MIKQMYIRAVLLLTVVGIMPYDTSVNTYTTVETETDTTFESIEDDVVVDIDPEIKPVVGAGDEAIVAPPPLTTVTKPEEPEEPEEPKEEFVSVSYIPEYIQKLCYEIGAEYDISPELLIAIIERESSGRVKAVNKRTGCMGLMQLHPKYADYYLKKAGCSDPFNPEHNIRAGCEMLKEKIKQYKHLPLVLMKYHGESNTKTKYKTGNYSKYCKTILARMEEIKESKR